MLNTWIAAPWIRLSCELVGLDPGDCCAMTPSDLRALIRERHAAAWREVNDDLASVCEQDMCGECTGCGERARVNFEQGGDECACCGFTMAHRSDGPEGGCVYAEAYTPDERAAHRAAGGIQ